MKKFRNKKIILLIGVLLFFSGVFISVKAFLPKGSSSLQSSGEGAHQESRAEQKPVSESAETQTAPSEETNAETTSAEEESHEETAAKDTTLSEKWKLFDYPSREQYEIMVEMIQGGDFSCLNLRDPSVENYAHLSDRKEWVLCDIDKDGFEELILQEKEPVYKGSFMHRIDAGFTYREDGMHCFLMDQVDGTEFYYLGGNGNLIYSTTDFFGDNNGTGQYTCYTIHETGEKIPLYKLRIRYIDGVDNTFYDKYTAEEGCNENDWESESLTRDDFLAAFQEMTGYAFEDASYGFEYIMKD